MAKGDVLVRLKADVSNYDANIAKARKTLDGFKQDNLTLGGIMNQSTKSIVAAAAQYASFAAVIGTVASGFAEAVSKGKEMSREAEGVSMAFERLNKPGLLDNLREATHNTVNDLELMKQAVKFDNFNLSIEQMGTFLAFAQQQAKDTGQDVNYLVDSIVTGLGRKSLPILDNLGLSAEEIKNRMKETGDMTTAVAEIIQERMEAAGGYVETAADRAAQGQARLDNAMKELGDTMNSLSGSGAALWSELEIGAVNLANNAIKPLIKLFNELASYINGTSVEDIVTSGMTDVTDTVDDNGRLIRKDAINNIPEITVTGNAPKVKPRTGGNTTKTEQTELQKNQSKINTLTQEYVTLGDSATESARQRQAAIREEISLLVKRNDILKLRSEQAQGRLLGGMPFEMPDISRGIGLEPSSEVKGVSLDDKAMKALSKQLKDAIPERKEMKVSDVASNIAGGLSSITSGIEQLGIEIPQGLKDVLGGIQAIATILTGISALITIITAIQGTKAIPVIGFLAANGGIARAAGGYRVPGNFNSGDLVPAALSSGELVLNKAQSASLANQLNDNNMFRNLNIDMVIEAEQLRGVLNNNGRRTGRGEYVQSRRRTR